MKSYVLWHKQHDWKVLSNVFCRIFIHGLVFAWDMFKVAIFIKFSDKNFGKSILNNISFIWVTFCHTRLKTRLQTVSSKRKSSKKNAQIYAQIDPFPELYFENCDNGYGMCNQNLLWLPLSRLKSVRHDYF